MSEDGNLSPAASSPPIAWKWLNWVGGISFLAGLSVVLLYVYGDPRPMYVDPVSNSAPQINNSEVTPNSTYYRIRADYQKLTKPVAAGNSIAALWTFLFGEAVAQAGTASVQLRLSHPASLRLPRDKDGYLLLDVSTAETRASSVTSYLVRQSDERVELRLEVLPNVEAPSGILPKLLWFAASDRPLYSGWVSVFAGGPEHGTQGPDARKHILAVRDFTGRAIGTVSIGIETRSSMLFRRFLAAGDLERLIEVGKSFEVRRDIALGLIRGVSDLPAELKDAAVIALTNTKPANDPADDDANCRQLYLELSGNTGLSNGDAAWLAFLLRYQLGMKIDRSTSVCGALAMTNALNSLGMIEAFERLRPAQTVIAKKEVTAAAEFKKDERPMIERRYVCLGLSGPRIVRHCEALNNIAREWRGGGKFLQMTASRQHIAPHVGLEEPTPDMDYSSRRFGDRRQLLIHIALSRVENFACFRQTHENPDYFEALLVMRENDSGDKRRLDVFEFAFESDGRVGRIRRRAAMQSDIDKAGRLPKTSRCHREFLSEKGTHMQRLVRDYWQLTSVGD